LNRASWATPIPAVIALGVGAVVMIGAAVLMSTDPPGRALIGLAALALAALAVLAGIQRPKLAVDGDEMIVRTLRGTRSYHRGDVERVRLVPYPRLGRRVPMLEIDVRTPIDAEERLLIFGRWDLGTDPRGVFDELVRRGFVPEADQD
jgi:hypothetical protein